MFYDAPTKTLVMIQITIDQNHQIHYDSIIGFIKGGGPSKNYYKKYKDFFYNLKTSHLVSKYVYQWMTNKVYEKLIEKSEKAKKDLGDDANLIEIINYDLNLITQIEQAQK